MPFLKREVRLKRIAQDLRHSLQSAKNVKLSDRAYKRGESTTLDEMADFVRTHRPSSPHVDLRANEAEHPSAEELVPR